MSFSSLKVSQTLLLSIVYVIFKEDLALQMNFNEKIVLVGGGGGVYRIASKLKNIRPNITTIQTMFDCGGHSGKLRDERGMLPPGDIRQAILALSDDTRQPMLRKLLSHRFSVKNNSSLDGVPVGNILLTALTEINDGNFIAAIEEMCRLCEVKGKVIPVSLDDAHLVVTFNDGTTMRGETFIDRRSPEDERYIVEASLDPQANMFVDAHTSIAEADKIIFCPGDFWTSLIPNTLVEGFMEAIHESKAQKILVVNIMTKKAETHGYTAETFVEYLCCHLGIQELDAAIYNCGIIPETILNKYQTEQSYQVSHLCSPRARKKVIGQFADWNGDIIRHNQKVISAIAEL